jgi:hypothetical protein
MAQTVTECLTAATDSVTVINSINTDGSSSAFWLSVDITQAEINEMIQRNVDHLEIILAYAPEEENDDTPDIVGDSSDKSSYINAITTGKAYIAAN